MSLEINLLPWREKRRMQRTRRFKQSLLVVLLLGLLAGWGIAQRDQALVREQQARLAMIERHAESLDHDIEAVREFHRLRERMLGQIELIGALQASRPLTVRVFDQLSATLVDGIYYTELERKGARLEFSGVAASNRQVSDQMRAMAASDVFGVPLLSDVQSGDDPQVPKRLHMSVDELMVDGADPEAGAGEGWRSLAGAWAWLAQR